MTILNVKHWKSTKFGRTVFKLSKSLKEIGIKSTNNDKPGIIDFSECFYFCDISCSEDCLHWCMKEHKNTHMHSWHLLSYQCMMIPPHSHAKLVVSEFPSQGFDRNAYYRQTSWYFQIWEYYSEKLSSGLVSPFCHRYWPSRLKRFFWIIHTVLGTFSTSLTFPSQRRRWAFLPSCIWDTVTCLRLYRHGWIHNLPTPIINHLL